METVRQIIEDIIERLSTVEELKYVDRDWGQLDCEPPAVKYPCALVDFDHATYQPLMQGAERAEASFNVVVAAQRITPSSSRARRKEDSYATMNLVGKVHAALHLMAKPNYAPLTRRSTDKEALLSGEETYRISYTTSFNIKPQQKTTARVEQCIIHNS